MKFTPFDFWVTKKRGFTLIELLLVITVIAILSALLLPALANARTKAKQINCMNNEQQLALAFTMYSQDYDDFIVPRAALPSGTAYWRWTLEPYLGPHPQIPNSIVKVETWFCPEKFPPAGAIWNRNWIGYDINKSYWDIPTKLTRVNHPDRVVLMGETQNASGSFSYYYAVPFRNGRFDHFNSMNVIFSDHHVEAMHYQHPAFRGTTLTSGPYWNP